MRSSLVAVGIVLSVLAVAPPSTGQEVTDWRQRVIAQGDLNIEIFSKGEGPPVLMHPGAFRPAEDLQALGDRIAEAGYRAVAINARGMGRSVGPTEGVTTGAFSSDLWMVADALGLSEVHLLGHAFGNRVVRRASAEQSGRVLSITLLSAGGEIGPSSRFAELAGRYLNPELQRQQRLAALREAFFAPGHESDDWADILEPKAFRWGVDVQEGMAAWYQGGTAPMLIIHGLQDLVAPPQNAWNLAIMRPNARLIAIPNCGHAMLPEQPVAIANAVIAFLLELDE